MRHIEGEVEEKRLLRGGTSGEPALCLIDKHLSAIASGLFPAGLAAEPRIDVTIAPAILGLADGVAAMHQHILKPAVLRPARKGLTEAPCADDRRAIARRAQHFGQQRHVRTNQIAPCHPMAHPASEFMLAAQNLSTRRRATWCRDATGKIRAGCSQAVKVWGVQVRVAARRQISVALVARQNKQYIGTFRCRPQPNHREKYHYHRAPYVNHRRHQASNESR